MVLPQGNSAKSLLKDGFRTTMPAFGTAVVFSFFTNLLVFVSPLYMLQIYDRVITSRNETTLYAITAIAGYLLLVYAVLEMLRSRVLVRAGILFDEKIANPIFDAVHRGSLRQPGGNHAQALRDVDSIREFLTGAGLIALCDAPWVPIFVFACFILHPWFGWIAIAGSLIILGLTLLNEFATSKLLGEASKASIAANQQAQATLRNGEVLHAMGMLDALRQLWSASHSHVIAWQARASDRAGVIIASTKFVRMFLQVVILGTGAYLAIQKEISPGSMIAASIIIGRALAPVELVVANWKGMTNARNGFRRLVQLLAIAGDEPERMKLPKPTGRLELDNVVAVAPGQRKPILSGISFAVQPGEIVGVVGPSAAGKSTLARVITGVWPTVGGAVRLDGADIAHWNAQELGQYIGYLPQDVELFSGTIAENICRFEEADGDEIVEIAQLAGCHEMIQQLVDGYDTQIGEGGHALSGGQRQRIALARALFGKPCLVVLDEPNASLDTAGEEALLHAVQSMKAAGSTVFIITHKVNILASTDKILVMAQGTVQAFGPRDEVLRRLAGPRAVAAATA
ncbi:type I secretion system permease/ATPase [Rhodopseudomonas palustris]|uniref:type I secretion system permease/ATPase n=1 Tax=Rhodopseudomonas palustris TaxID=1076 RepID=UPI000D1A8527|nr:type I secretion system permease/ATPase [Rhodopseudomonas palustris]